jgi:hypothetical protein
MKYSAICVMCKDDEKALIENIQYHLLLGFDHIIVYDNNSVTPLSNQLYFLPNVTINTWSDNSHGSQCRCYTKCLNQYRKYFNWIAFIDTDEFIVLNKENNIKDFLKRYENYGGVGINWKCFGSSGHNNIQDSIIDSYVHCPNINSYDRHIKSIVNTNKAIGSINPHCFSYIDNYYCVNEHKQKIENAFNDPPSYDYAQINHYIVRSREDFELKLKRGGGNNKKNHKMNESVWESFQRGSTDTAIHNLLNRIKYLC